MTSSSASTGPGAHGGIDLRTNGVGREVFAAARIHQPRALFALRVRQGRLPAIERRQLGGLPRLLASTGLEDFVRREQHGRKSYTVDIHLQAGQFPIRKGQLIAKSGQTGIGAPHLHFEMRDTSGEPVNPRLLGFDWPDSTPPRIDKVLVAAKGLDGRVNGDIVPMVLDATVTATASAPPSGRACGVADVTDPGVGGYNLGVHRPPARGRHPCSACSMIG